MKNKKASYKYIKLRLPAPLIEKLARHAIETQQTKSELVHHALGWLIDFDHSFFRKATAEQKIRQKAKKDMLKFIQQKGGIEKFQEMPSSLVSLNNDNDQ